MLPRPRPPAGAPEDVLATRAPSSEHPLGGSDVNPVRRTFSGCETAALSPAPQRRSHRGAVELEGFTQVDERVRPAAIVLLDPGFGLGDELRDAKVEADRVLEHGEHEPFLGLYRSPCLGCVELGGEDGFELVPVAFLGLWSAPARHAAPRCKRPARHPQRWKAADPCIRGPGAPAARAGLPPERATRPRSRLSLGVGMVGRPRPPARTTPGLYPGDWAFLHALLPARRADDIPPPTGRHRRPRLDDDVGIGERAAHLE